MKLLSLLLSLVLSTAAARRTFVATSIPRGGASIGPLDSDLALQLAKTGAVAYAAGSASKYINKQTGGDDSQLSDFVTGEHFALNTLCIAIAAGMFHLADTGFDALKLYGALKAGALALKLQSDGISVDTLKDNAVLAVGTAVVLYLAFVE